uniref:Uncharacterized protein n=1 Tax=Corethron hystrix TaxID=216773 RepID=A0A7S1FQQ4_9STRA
MVAKPLRSIAKATYKPSPAANPAAKAAERRGGPGAGKKKPTARPARKKTTEPAKTVVVVPLTKANGCKRKLTKKNDKVLPMPQPVPLASFAQMKKNMTGPPPHLRTKGASGIVISASSSATITDESNDDNHTSSSKLRSFSVLGPQLQQPFTEFNATSLIPGGSHNYKEEASLFSTLLPQLSNKNMLTNLTSPDFVSPLSDPNDSVMKIVNGMRTGDTSTYGTSQTLPSLTNLSVSGGTLTPNPNLGEPTDTEASRQLIEKVFLENQNISLSNYGNDNHNLFSSVPQSSSRGKDGDEGASPLSIGMKSFSHSPYPAACLLDSVLKRVKKTDTKAKPPNDAGAAASHGLGTGSTEKSYVSGLSGLSGLVSVPGSLGSNRTAGSSCVRASQPPSSLGDGRLLQQSISLGECATPKGLAAPRNLEFLLAENSSGRSQDGVNGSPRNIIGSSSNICGRSILSDAQSASGGDSVDLFGNFEFSTLAFSEQSRDAIAKAEVLRSTTNPTHEQLKLNGSAGTQFEDGNNHFDPAATLYALSSSSASEGISPSPTNRGGLKKLSVAKLASSQLSFCDTITSTPKKLEALADMNGTACADNVNISTTASTSSGVKAENNGSRSLFASAMKSVEEKDAKRKKLK